MTDYPALVGKIIADKYRIDRLLGQGGMGLVYSAQHVDLARPVAVKLIRRELMETESVAERFLLEARAAAKIQSEHVGRVLDVGRLDTGEPYIVMEYLEGQDLAVHLEQYGRFDYVAAVDLVLEACEALAEAHHHQIVHRDLKPENLFLVDQPDGGYLVKVLDFGISKQLGETSQRALTSPATALGSPQYMSPEQMEGAHVDVRSDIWALGTILYEMVTGRRTFDGETLAQVCVQVLSGNVTPVRSLVPDVPFELATAIEQCLRQRPEERFANVGAFARAIEPFGSERARFSTQRIVGVLGLGGERPTNPGQRHGHDAYPGSTTPRPHRITPGSQPVSAMSRTEVATDGTVGPSSHTVTVNRSGARLPIFLGLFGVIALGAAVWAFTRSQIGDARMHTTTPAEAQSALGAIGTPEVPEPAVTPVAAPTSAAAAELGASTSTTPSMSAEPKPTALPEGTAQTEAVPAESSRGLSQGNVTPSRVVKPVKSLAAPPRPAEAPSSVKPSAAEADGFGGRK